MYRLSDIFQNIEIKDEMLRDALKSITVKVDNKNEITSKQDKLEVDISLANTLFIECIRDYFDDHEEIKDYQIHTPQRMVSIAELYDTYLDIILLNSEYVTLKKVGLINRSIENCLDALMNLRVYRGKPLLDWLIIYLQGPIRRLLYSTFIEPVIKSDSTLLNEKHINDETLLMLEIRLKCELYMIEDLLNLGVDPNIQDEKRCTPLMYSAYYYQNGYNEALVALLKKYGADFGVVDNNGISYGKYFLIYKIREINKETVGMFNRVGSESPSSKRLEVLNSSDGPIMYFPNNSFDEKDKLTSEEYFKFSKVLSEDYECLPIPLFIRNSPSWIFEEIRYNKIKDLQPDQYQKIINWD